MSANGKLERVCARNGIIIFVFMAAICASAFGEITLLDNRYKVETYAVYPQTSSVGLARYMTADGNGNVYVGHGNASSLPTSIMVSNRNGTRLLKSGWNNLQGLILGEGTTYGNYLYAAETNANRIMKIDDSGHATTFTTLPHNTMVMDIDHTGNYGNKMYVGTFNSSRVYRVDESGYFSEFVNLDSKTDGSIRDIAIDTTGRFGGNMYISLFEVSNPAYQGILAIDPLGNVSQYYPGGYWGCLLAFDTTDEQVFGGNLFGGGSYLKPNGESGTLFTSDLCVQDVTFSPDGAMYVMETTKHPSYYNNTIIISKITAIPEPASILLLSLGALSLIRKSKG